MRSVMNRFKLLSGGLTASLMVLVAASAVAQEAGQWTMTGRTYDLHRYSPLTAINKTNVKSLKAASPFSPAVRNGHEGNPLVTAGAHRTNAAIVIKDLVIAGLSGGEFGVGGRGTAYDVNTGKEVGRAYSTGPDAEVKIVGDANPNYPSMRGKDLGVSTWQGDEWQHGGGTTWGWYSYDPTSNTFYYSTGNPGTWNPDQRPGDNNSSMTIFARNPDNGEAKWAYQMTPHDEWDYDGVNENVLFDATIGGKAVN